MWTIIGFKELCNFVKFKSGPLTLTAVEEVDTNRLSYSYIKKFFQTELVTLAEEACEKFAGPYAEVVGDNSNRY